MSAKYSVKRNSLSSKWGVWAVQQSSGSPVENLVAEFKNQAHAETYKERVETGESHAAIMAIINTKPVKSSSGGMFGRFFKRGVTSAEKPERQTVTNAVIEIQPRQPAGGASENQDVAVGEMPAQPKSASKVAAPSRFQFIEPPARPVRATKSKVGTTADSSDEPAREVEERVDEKLEAISTPPEAQVLLAPEDEVDIPVVVDEEEKVTEDISEVVEQEEAETIAATPKSKPVPADNVDENGVLVDWTFSPPPDVTPEEVRASSQEDDEDDVQQDDDLAVAEPESIQAKRNVAQIAEKPAVQTKAPDTELVAAETVKPSSVTSGGTESRMTVDICVSKALKDSAVGNPKVSDKKYNSIASKEYTEVSKAFATGNSHEHLREELTHLAAVCLAWADAIAKRQASDAEEQAA